jgi:hypothetical protein
MLPFPFRFILAHTISQSVSNSQLIDQPTRLTNTLDLVFTNRPGKELRTETIPGISDHDIVYTEFDFRPVKLKQKPALWTDVSKYFKLSSSETFLR